MRLGRLLSGTAASVAVPVAVGAAPAFAATWSVVTSQAVGTQSGLGAMDLVSATDGWAVGYYRDLPYGNRQRHPLALHWNGQSWTLTPTPNVGTIQTFLRGVAAVSATDAWAVGYANDALGGMAAVVLRWNGQGRSVATAPPLATLQSVTALSANDIWAAGTGGDGLPSTFFTGMAALAPSTVWALGTTADPTTGASQPRVIRSGNG